MTHEQLEIVAAQRARDAIDATRLAILVGATPEALCELAADAVIKAAQLSAITDPALYSQPKRLT